MLLLLCRRSIWVIWVKDFDVDPRLDRPVVPFPKDILIQISCRTIHSYHSVERAVSHRRISTFVQPSVISMRGWRWHHVRRLRFRHSLFCYHSMMRLRARFASTRRHLLLLRLGRQLIVDGDHLWAISMTVCSTVRGIRLTRDQKQR